MPNYRPVISRDDLQQLEHYLYVLARYIDTAEFQKDISSQAQGKLLNEMGYITMAIDILKKTFTGTGNDIPIVGWEVKNPDDEYGFFKLWHFTSAATAARILGLNNSHIGSVCRGVRQSTGGWAFKFKAEYEEEEVYSFDPNSPRFEIIKTSNGKEQEDGTAPSDGDV